MLNGRRCFPRTDCPIGGSADGLSITGSADGSLGSGRGPREIGFYYGPLLTDQWVFIRLYRTLLTPRKRCKRWNSRKWDEQGAGPEVFAPLRKEMLFADRECYSRWRCRSEAASIWPKEKVIKQSDTLPAKRCFEYIDYFKDFENEFPAIVYKDALTSEPEVSSEPTVSAHHVKKVDFDFVISFDESDDEDYTFTYDKNLFSYKLFFVNDLKSDSENDDDKIDIKQSSGDISVEPLPDVIINIEHMVKVSEKARIMEHKRRVHESLLILTTYTAYHSRSIHRIQDSEEFKDHCLTLKNTPYPHQRYAVYNTLVNEEEPTGFTSIRRIHQEDAAYPCPNFTKTSMTRRHNTPYLEAFICRIERQLMNILEYYNRTDNEEKDEKQSQNDKTGLGMEKTVKDKAKSKPEKVNKLRTAYCAHGLQLIELLAQAIEAKCHLGSPRLFTWMSR
ncbi:hypothetical protein Tco_1542048 [Tanacetum coccineum]